MDASHSQLGKTRDEYLGQHGLLKKSKGLLGTLNWQQRSETILLWFGLALFALTAAYVAQKRVFYFVPEAVKPMTVLRTTASLVKSGAEAGVDASKAFRRTPTEMPPVPPPPVIPPKEAYIPPISVAVKQDKLSEVVAPIEQPIPAIKPTPKEAEKVEIETLSPQRTTSLTPEEPPKVAPKPAPSAVPSGKRPRAAAGKRLAVGQGKAPQAAGGKMAPTGKVAPGAKGKFVPAGKAATGKGGVAPSGKKGGAAPGAKMPSSKRPTPPGGKGRQGQNGGAQGVKNNAVPAGKKENVARNVQNEL